MVERSVSSMTFNRWLTIVSKLILLTHFMPLISFCTPWKYQKTSSFLISRHSFLGVLSLLFCLSPLFKIWRLINQSKLTSQISTILEKMWAYNLQHFIVHIKNILPLVTFINKFNAVLTFQNLNLSARQDRDYIRRYRKRPVTWNRLILRNALKTSARL